MIRQLLIAAVMGLALSACGVGYDEDPATLGIEAQGLDQGAVATQDPVPPKTEPVTLGVIVLPGGIPVAIKASSATGSPGNPGDQNSSSQDPIPPKNSFTANGPPVPGDNPLHYERL
jgi:hypothetical protein